MGSLEVNINDIKIEGLTKEFNGKAQLINRLQGGKMTSPKEDFSVSIEYSHEKVMNGEDKISGIIGISEKEYQSLKEEMQSEDNKYNRLSARITIEIYPTRS